MRGSWSLRLWGEDNTNSLIEERRDRGMRDLGVYAFGARTARVYPLRKRRDGLGSTPSARTTPNSLIEEEARSRDEGSWSLRLRGEDKRVYPLRKRREVLGSTPSGRGQNEFIH
jgi:hypothetical protein